jgi:hypothetical protein
VAPVPEQPKTMKRSRGAMVTGIVLSSIAPFALLGAYSAGESQELCDQELEDRYPNHVVPSYERDAVERCDEYTTTMWVLGVSGVVLLAAGVPLIIYGAKTVPAPKQARVLPWASPTGGGLRLRLDL